MFSHLPTHWQSFRCINRTDLPSVWSTWLLTSDSLTARLKSHCKAFKVNVLRQELKKPQYDEAEILQMKRLTVAMIREVELLCDNQICVKARSIIPLATLQRNKLDFKNLGSRPLIELLSKDKNLIRSEFEIARVFSCSETLWGRRSIFSWFNHPILVSEFFLPNILELNRYSIKSVF